MKRIEIKPFMLDYKGQEFTDPNNPLHWNEGFRVSLYDGAKIVESEVFNELDLAAKAVVGMIKKHKMEVGSWDLPTGFNVPAFAEAVDRVSR